MDPQTAPQKLNNRKIIGLMGPFGYGNLGDAAIQQAMLQHIYKLFPQAEVIGFSLNPEDTEKRHGIRSYPIGRMSAHGWALVNRPFGGIQKIADQMRHSSKRIVRLAGKFIFSAPLEVLSIWQASKWLKGMDVFLVSGGGQLDDYWGGAWGHPYSLFIWALLAKLCGVKFFVVSVGAGPLAAPMSKWFVRMTLRMAQYRSYRDIESKEFVIRIGFKNDDPVYPDLAQSLIVRPVNTPQSPAQYQGTVGIGPMAYFDPRVWPEKDSRVYQGYLSKLAEFCCWLLRKNFRILLFPGGAINDIPVIEDLLAIIKNLDGEIAQGQLLNQPVETVDTLMDHLSQTDLVVASRFHGVLLSQIIYKPVLALSYHQKIESLMKDTGEAQYCLQINTFDVQTIIECFQDLWYNRLQIQDEIKKHVEAYQQKLDDQYEHIFNAI